MSEIYPDLSQDADKIRLRLSERHMERIRKQVGRISGNVQAEGSGIGAVKMERQGSRGEFR